MSKPIKTTSAGALNVKKIKTKINFVQIKNYIIGKFESVDIKSEIGISI